MQKKITAFLMLIVLLLSLLPAAAFAAPAVSALPAAPAVPTAAVPAAGEWVLQSVQDEKGQDRVTDAEDTSNGLQGAVRCVYARASYAFDWSLTSMHNDKLQTGSGQVTAAFHGLPERIPANQTVTITASMTSSARTSDPSPNEDRIFCQAQIQVAGPLMNSAQSWVSYDIPFLTYDVPYGDWKSWSFGFAESTEGKLADVGFILCGPDGVQAMGTIYHYKYVPVKAAPSPQALPKEIELSGLVRSAANTPMPWMKLQAWVYYETESYQSTQPDLVVDGITDHLGRYKLKIPLREEDAKPLGILLVGTLECVYPFEDKQTAFYFVDTQDPVSSSLKQTNVSTWISVKPENYAKEAEEGQPIRISRLLAFYNLGQGAWSYDDGLMPDPVYYFSSGDQVQTIQDLSYLYTIAYDAWFFGAVTLGEQSALLIKPLCIEARWRPSSASESTNSHYTADDNTIRLDELDCKRDDVSRFAILHEFGHAFDAMTLKKASYRGSQGMAATDVNHGGYFNNSSADSYIEGFATCFAGLVQRYSAYPNPEKLDRINLTTPSAYVAWRDNGVNEELSIASFLYYLHGVVANTADYWALLKPEYNNFKEYYDTFKAALPKSAAALDSYAFDAGLFKMPFGNGKFDLGEPFKDINKNGTYDPGEPYVDLMYDVDTSGIIDPNKTLKSLDKTALIYGATSVATGGAASGTASATPSGAADSASNIRNSIKAPVDNSLALTGTVPEYLLVDIVTDKDSTRMLRATNNGSILLGLPEAPAVGKVTVSVPGGNVIYTSDLAKLQVARDSHIGQPIPLDTAQISAKDLAPAGTQVAATYGDPNADGLMPEPLIYPEELAGAAQGYTINAPLSQVAAEHGGTPPSGDGMPQSGGTSTGGGATTVEPYGNISGGNSTGGSHDVTPEPDMDQGIFATTYGPVLIIAIVVVLAAAAVILIVVIVRRGKKHQPPAGPMAGASPRPPTQQPYTPSGPHGVPPTPPSGAPPTQFCTGCGSPVAPGSDFCTRCGRPMR